VIVITAATRDYYPLVRNLVRSLRRVSPSLPLYVYDLDGELDQGDERFDVVSAVEFRAYCGRRPSPYHSGPVDVPQAGHKPFCIRHAVEIFQQPVLWLDADMLVLKDLQRPPFVSDQTPDMMFTVRAPNRVNVADEMNGAVNAGVVFADGLAIDFMDIWCKETPRGRSDQAALNALLLRWIKADQDGWAWIAEGAVDAAPRAMLISDLWPTHGHGHFGFIACDLYNASPAAALADPRVCIAHYRGLLASEQAQVDYRAMCQRLAIGGGL
jgi:hypothetical protein